MTELERAADKIRKKFKIALVERGLKQKDVARIIGTSEAQVSRALAGNSTPKDIAIQKEAARFLEIEL